MRTSALQASTSSRSASGRSSSPAHSLRGSIHARAPNRGSASTLPSISRGSTSSTRRAGGRYLPAELLPQHAVCREVFLVQLPAEPRRVAQLDRAFLEPRPVGDEVPPDRVAVGVEAFD